MLVILNGISRKKNVFYKKLLPALQSNYSVEVRETSFAGHAEVLALEAANQQQWDAVLAAGGDGTLSQVLNGLMKGPVNRPALGLIPLGSGNDFARTVGARGEANHLVHSLRQAPRLIDVGRVQLHTAEGVAAHRYFINVCSVGMGPAVVGRIVNDRSGWAPGAVYLKAIVNTFLSLKPTEVHVRHDQGEWMARSRVVAIANGRAFGHGIFIAPDADLADGRFNTFLAGDFSLWRFLLLLQQIKSGQKVQQAGIVYGNTTAVTVTSPRPMPVEAEGELIGFTPLQCEVLPKAIRFLH